MDSKLKILVVDDNLQTNKELFDSFLNRNAFHVYYVSTKNEFFEVDVDSYDVVLLDINLDLWKLTYEEALQIIGEKAPIVLTSTAFKESFTTKKLQEGRWRHPDSKIIQVFDMRLLTLGVEEGAINVTSANTFAEILIAVVPPKARAEENISNEVTILHISDPQYGDPGTSDWSILLEQQIGVYLKNNSYEPDAMVISGDIAFSGKHEEYEIAKVEMKKLLEATSLQNNSNALILVPGNHDVDFRMSSVPALKSTIDRENNRVTVEQVNGEAGGDSVFGMALFRRFAFELTSDLRWIKSDNLSWINDKLNHLGVRFIHLNTANSISTNNISIPSLDAEMTKKLADELRREDNYFTIAVSHHGPSEKRGENKDHLSSDWARISQLFKVGCVQLWLHGHGHARLTLLQSMLGDPTETTDLPKGSGKSYKMELNEVVRVMAPSSHLNHKKRAIGERRGFNIIKLKKLEGGIINEIEIIHFEVTERGIVELPVKTAHVLTRRKGAQYI